MSRLGLAIASMLVELACVLAAGQSPTIIDRVSQTLAARAQKKEAAPAAATRENAPLAASHENSLTVAADGRRDPFVSPVVNRSMVGSNCSAGRRCLAAEQISLKGVVRSPSGMIAVVINSAGKAYFLRERDVVLRGYVKRITEDSVIFSETVPDKLGKPQTHEVVRKLSATPAA